jgi:DNA polymerase-3 subunit delta'
MGLDAWLVDASGAPPLPWLAEPLQAALSGHRGHALLVQAAPGNGALAFGLTMAQSWLCEAEAGSAARACGRCGSCRLVLAHGHPDLTVLLPETARRELDWPLPDDKPESERKPSRQIRVDDVRLLIDRATRTSARGHGKVGLVFPADLMNAQAANALLKTLEEPAPGTRLLLVTGEPTRLLPTVRSRCQALRLPAPAAGVAAEWLAAQSQVSADAARVLLAACSGRPLDALAMVQSGMTAEAWNALPAEVSRGSAASMSGWSVPQVVDALQKLCHDALACSSGAEPRYFAAAALPPVAAGAPLAAWAQELARVARYAEHPWNDGLLVEALVRQGSCALAPGNGGDAAVRSSFVTLPA